MQPLVGHDPIATATFAVVFGGWILFEIILTGRRRPSRGERSRDRGSGLLVFGAMFVAFMILLKGPSSVPEATMSASPWMVFGVAIVIALAGFGLRVWAIRELGRSFTAAITVSPGQTVVQSGPYRLIRHPSYAGALVTVFGAALALANWVSLVAVVPIFLAYAYRIGVEERALERELGRPYADYRRTTRRLIPFVY